MLDVIPETLLQGVYAKDELDRNTNLDFPLNMHKIREEQELDGKLQVLVKAKHRDVSTATFGTTEVYTVKGKVWVPPNLQPRIIEWYHDNLQHPGVTRTISQKIKHLNGTVYAQVEKHIKTCDACQHHKITGKLHYGQLPLVTALCDKTLLRRFMWTAQDHAQYVLILT